MRMFTSGESSLRQTAIRQQQQNDAGTMNQTRAAAYQVQPTQTIKGRRHVVEVSWESWLELFGKFAMRSQWLSNVADSRGVDQGPIYP
jgi:hypothetical protein